MFVLAQFDALKRRLFAIFAVFLLFSLALPFYSDALQNLLNPARPFKPSAVSEAPDISGSVRDYLKADQLKIQQAADGSLRAWSSVKGLFYPNRAVFNPKDDSNLWQVEFIPQTLNGRPLTRGAPTAKNNVVYYALGRGVTELYENREEGIEQKFTITDHGAGNTPDRPAGGEHGLRLEGVFETTLTPARIPGQGIVFTDRNGIAQFSYGEATLIDAQGRRVPMEMVLESPDGDQHSIALFVTPAASSALIFPLTIDPLISTPTLTLDPTDQASARFGVSIFTAGDVNGDGYSDVIIGADRWDGEATNEGRVYVYHGSSTGLSSTPALTLDPTDQANAEFGISAALAGDVNGDGYSDVIIGADRWDGEATDEGRAYIYHGSSTGLSSTPALTLDPADLTDAQFGGEVFTAGDVNGDGYSDVVIGALGWDGDADNEGRVYVYHGSSAGISSTPALTLDPTNQASAQFGAEVFTAGDVNGDGYSDILVSAFLWDGDAVDEGRAYIYHGSSTGLSSTPALTLDPADQANAEFGISVAPAGDVNGDGYSDVVIGAWQWDGDAVDEGRAYIYYGSATGLPSSPDLTLDPTNQASAQFGVTVSTAGDVNGDGYSDVVIGAWQWDGDAADEGRAYLYQGSSSGLSSTAALTLDPTNQASANFGLPVATAGDVNGDGYSDVLIGAIFWNGEAEDEGRVYVFSGSADGLASSAGLTLDPTDQEEAQFGWAVSSAGDVNGDGYSDVVVGAFLWDGEASNEGRAYIYLGSSTGLSSTAARILDPTDAVNGWFGRWVASGDVNGDGYSDVLVGTGGAGIVYVYHGSSSGIPATPVLTIDPVGLTQFGLSVASADVNGDGYADLIAAARDVVRVYHGSATGISSTEAISLGPLDQSGARFGWEAAASAGDVNGDGYADVIIGAYLWDGEATDEGRVYVYHGSSTGLSSTAALTLDPTDQASARFGNFLAPAGDVNGDGYADVVIGASLWDGGATTDEGRVYVYHGSSTGLSSTAALTLDPTDATNAQFGDGLASAGDVNGDGYSDIAVNAPNVDQTYIYHGSSTGLSSSAALTLSEAIIGSGKPVSSAGDVNGDGYADVLLGNRGFDGEATNEGRVSLFYGGGGRGLALAPRQLRTDGSTPIQLGGVSDSGSSFVASVLARTPSGRGDARFEVETKSNLAAFDGVGTVQSSTVDTGVSGNAASATLSGLTNGTRYHWRARLLYNRSPITYFGGQVSRWIYFGGNGSLETDLRTASIVSTGSTTPASPAPAPPTGIAASYVSTPPGFNLTWTDPPTNATQIEIWRNDGGATPITGPHAAVPIGRGQYTDTSGIQVNTAYLYQLIAVGSGGRGVSQEVVATSGAPGETAPPRSAPVPEGAALGAAKSVAIVSQGLSIASASPDTAKIPSLMLGIALSVLMFASLLLHVHHGADKGPVGFFAIFPLLFTSSRDAYMSLRDCGPADCAGRHFNRHRKLFHFARASVLGTVAAGLVKLFFAAVLTALIPSADRLEAQGLSFTDNGNGVRAGGRLTYHIDISNPGTLRNSNVLFIDQIPEGTDYIPGTLVINAIPSLRTPSNGIVSLPFASLLPGQIHTVEFSVSVRTDASGLIQNKAEVSSSEVISAVSSNTVTNPIAAIAAPLPESEPEPEPESAEEPVPPEETLPEEAEEAGEVSEEAEPPPPAPSEQVLPVEPVRPAVTPSPLPPPPPPAPSSAAPPAAPEAPPAEQGAPQAPPSPAVPVSSDQVGQAPVAVVSTAGFKLFAQNPAMEQKVEAAVENIIVRFEEIAPTIAKPVRIFNDRVLNEPVFEDASVEVVIPVTVATAAASAAVASTLPSFFSLLSFFFTQPLLFFTRRKIQAWGTVYNAITKVPVDLAVVRLVDAQSGRLVQTRVSDRYGRFAFLPLPGTYRIAVAKPQYQFPTELLKDEKEDIKFTSLYHGEPLTVTEPGTLLAPSIPLDPAVKEAPPKEIINKARFNKANRLLGTFSIGASIAGLLITPRMVTFILVGLHFTLYFIFKRLAAVRKRKKLNRVLDQATRKSLSYAIARIFDTRFNKLLESQVTDRSGRYGFLVGQNEYYVTAEKQGYQKTITAPINLRDKAEPEVVSVDVPLKKAGPYAESRAEPPVPVVSPPQPPASVPVPEESEKPKEAASAPPQPPQTTPAPQPSVVEPEPEKPQPPSASEQTLASAEPAEPAEDKPEPEKPEPMPPESRS